MTLVYLAASDPQRASPARCQGVGRVDAWMTCHDGPTTPVALPSCTHLVPICNPLCTQHAPSTQRPGHPSVTISPLKPYTLQAGAPVTANFGKSEMPVVVEVRLGLGLGLGLASGFKYETPVPVGVLRMPYPSLASLGSHYEVPEGYDGA